MSELNASKQSMGKNVLPGSSSKSSDAINEDLSKLTITFHPQTKVSEPKITGAVSKKYKIRHPTDPLPNVINDGRQKLPCPSTDKRKQISTSDSHLLSGPSPRSNSSSGSSPTSSAPLTPGRKKSSSMYGSSGGISPSPKIHVVFPSDLNISDLTYDGKANSKITTPDNVSNGKSSSTTKLNKGQRTPKKEKSFESYMMLDEVQQGMKKGELLEGVLRINPKNFQDAYISVPGERTDIYLGGILDRNRALNGDVVVVKLKPKEEWKILSSDLRNYIIRNNIMEQAYLTMQNNERKKLDELVKNKLEKKPYTAKPTFNTLNEEEILGKKSCRRGKRGKKKNKGPSASDLTESGSSSLGEIKKNATANEVYTMEQAKDGHEKTRKLRSKNRNKKDLKFVVNAEHSEVPVQSISLNLEVPYESNVCQVTDSIYHSNCSNESNIPQSPFPVIDNFDSSNFSAAGSDVEQNAKLISAVGNLAGTNDASISVSKMHFDNRELITNNWEAAAKNDNVAIIQLEDLLLEQPEPVMDVAEVLSDDGDSVDGEKITKDCGLAKVVPPDELSEQDDSASVSGHSSCGNEIHQVIEDEQFFAANFDCAQNMEHLTATDFSYQLPDFLSNNVCDIAPETDSSVESAQPQYAESWHVSAQVPNEESPSPKCSSTSGRTLDDIYFGCCSLATDDTQFKSVTPAFPDLNLQLQAILLRLPIDDVTVKDILQMPDGRKFIQQTAKVVYILETKNPRMGRGYLKLMQDKNPNWALFSPTDHRLPRIRIPMRQCPKDFFINYEIYATTLFIARITKWNNAAFAVGTLEKPLGEMGDIDAETQGILLEHGIIYKDFSDDVLDGLPQSLPWKIPEEELLIRRDFRQNCVFTIDPATARDLDDAVSCEPSDDGHFRIGVHIADVSYFVQHDTKLDSMAAERATSVYLVQSVIPMLPRLLCEQLCSLNPGEDRLAFSVEWTIRKDGAILNEWFGRSVINTCAKLSYDHAQAFIDDPERQFVAGFLPPINGKWVEKDIKERVLILHRIAQELRQKRVNRGSLRLDQIKLQFQLQETGLPYGYSVYVQRDSNRLIEEFMLLANMAVAHKIYKAFPALAVLRLHPPPQDRGMNEVTDFLEAFGIHLEWSTAGNLQKSLNKYLGNDELSLARHQVITMMLTKPMNRASYFCSGALKNEENYWHYALNVPLYTHFTSPIRRYPDILVHRLLKAALGIEQKLGTTGQLRNLANHCNDKKNAAKQVQELSMEIFLGAFIRDFGPIEEEAMVCAVMDRSFDVFVLKIGVVKRIYCEQLPLMMMEFVSSPSPPRLNLVFHPAKQQTSPLNVVVTIFTRIRVALTSVKDNPLKFNAIFLGIL